MYIPQKKEHNTCPGRTCKAARCVEVTQNSGLKHNEFNDNEQSQSRVDLSSWITTLWQAVLTYE